jgi:2-polyprenyl-6-methoxyphenol hydroxylase-like FAD-dependent oxidoreductase
LGLSFPEVAPCAWFAVFEFRSDSNVNDEVRVVLADDSTNVLWPLGDGWFRWSFQLPGYTDPDVERLAKYRQRFGEPTERVKDRLDGTSGDLNTLPDERLAGLMRERAPWFTGSIDEVGWRTVVRFERRLATGFGKGRCWLVGDAAHLGAPMAVQSLNVGLAEAHDLSRAIVASLRDGRGTEPLEGYENRYMAEWKRLQGVERTIEPLPQVDPWVWENRDRLLSCLPAHGAELSALASQLRLRV